MSKTMDELCVNTIRTLATQKKFGFVTESIIGTAKAQIARTRR